VKPFDQDSWQPAATPDNTVAFTRYAPSIGVLVLYERADHHWFLGVHRNRRRIGGHELGPHTEATAKTAALAAVGLREPEHPQRPLDDDFFAYSAGSCSSCKRDTDVLRFKSQCYECLASPTPAL
jgi:hypothetical protein